MFFAKLMAPVSYIIDNLQFLKESIKSNNRETAQAAATCMKNVRKTCTAIGQHREHNIQ